MPDENDINPEREFIPEDDGKELSPVERAVIEALFSSPFPKKPYALIPAGSSSTPDDTEYIIHKDIDTENQCVIIFDSIVDAFTVAEEFKEATDREAEPVECDVYSLEDRFWVKYYRANGVVAMMSVEDYRQHIGVNRSFE